jgi:hypothetical protein
LRKCFDRNIAPDHDLAPIRLNGSQAPNLIKSSTWFGVMARVRSLREYVKDLPEYTNNSSRIPKRPSQTGNCMFSPARNKASA